VGGGGSNVTSRGARPSFSCSQPQKKARSVRPVTLPSCHQKLGSVTKPRQSQARGKRRDHARLATRMNSTTTVQPPLARMGQAFFQSTHNSHQAHHSAKGTSASRIPSVSPIGSPFAIVPAKG